MSPVSRGRKRPKSSRSGERVIRPAFAEPEPCDCPECAAVEVDLQELVGNLLESGAELLGDIDPVDAEILAAGFLAAAELAGEGLAASLIDDVTPAVAEAGGPEALAILLALSAVAENPAATVAARELAATGVPAPPWAAELAQPIEAGDFRILSDAGGEGSMLLGTFTRAGRSDGFVLAVDHTDCHAATDITLFDGESWVQVVDSIRADARQAGLAFSVERPAPAEFRWQAERALDARAVHDQEDATDEEPEAPEWLGYHPVAMLFRARLRTLPVSSRPPAPHGAGSTPPRAVASLDRPAKLPAKRKKSAGPAPIYRIKVGLRGTKPPIWRRLELPADTGLAALDRIIRTAFGWSGDHMHIFQTPYGDFGVADRELDHRAEGPVTLEQVAPATGDRLRYVYDFGDDWAHDIVVEEALDREAEVAYPRCTGGRRAAPPEDCGGLPGYDDLLDIMADPAHPEHADRLDWLGLDSAAGFRPERFDADAVSHALSQLTASPRAQTTEQP